MARCKLLSILILSIAGQMSCKQGKPVSVDTAMEGRYVNRTFLEEIGDSLDFSPPAYCLQLVFTRSGKVFVDRGFEGDSLSFDRQGSGYRLLSATTGGDMPFTADADGKGLLLFDTAFTGVSRPSRFVRVEEDTEGVPTMTWMLNRQTVAGSYRHAGADSARRDTVVFHPDGRLTGLSGYVAYGLCHTGDCLQTTEPYHNIITLTLEDGSMRTCAFDMDADGKGIVIHSVQDPIPGYKGGRKLTGTLFTLRRA